MNKILKFVYEMILFLSLFHLAREVHDHILIFHVNPMLIVQNHCMSILK
ncbi:putative Late nodulin [Medicago truncatula]|uniref:Putative Late nodulin n=1 Tax=Medicago truncatula TaxID=3880 RepID=A0A396I157_MEDTR|nr:putative Late nodulin [Medicago truncatula]